MASLSKLQKRGLVRDGFVYGAHVGPDGVVHAIDFDGGGHGIGGFGAAMQGDTYVSLLYQQVPVRVVRVHWGEVVAREDLPKVLRQIALATV
ncbi:MAG: hypothetical protein PHX93_04980 [Candidatus Peribacteraceae bacterium]|jgi:hypothetical protein|nr:hypothetical protein [Candidatus Peribacteraceae bacterium]